ncbi:MAG TPA: nuclear transport factor 2 family protein [Candidatus Thermoplasmatota archaeon]
MTITLSAGSLCLATLVGAAGPVAVLSEMMDAVNAGDADRYARLYAPDAVLTIYGSRALTGRPAIEAHERTLLREFPGARLGFYAVWEKGPVAVVHYAVQGRTPAGGSMGHEGLLFYRFRPSGLIEEERRYLDGLTPMAQLGLIGPTPARPLPTLPNTMEAQVAKGSAIEDDNVARVRATFAALDAKDAAAFLSGLSEDAVLDDMIEPRPYRGQGQVKAWFETWTHAVPDARSEIATIIGAGDSVLVETVLRGTLKGPLGRLAPSDREFAVHRAVVVRLAGGKLTRITVFMNGRELAQAVGQWPLPAMR